MNGEPLPHRIRPSDWSAVHGHDSVIRSLRSRGPHSMILYGPPGTGKTTVSRLIASGSDHPYRELSAVNAGVKEVREVTEEAVRSLREGGRSIILFIDEIHRFSKSQQDALLHAVENGTLILIAATTENPGFAVTAPLLSRCRVYRLGALTPADLKKILKQAFETDPVLKKIRITEEAEVLLTETAQGDARALLRNAEAAAEEAILRTPLNTEGGEQDAVITGVIAEAVLDNVKSYDRTGDDHYDYASALIKSMRGSDPDASLLYLAVMIDRGEDPLFIARRLIIFAAEDIGNAWPQALPHAVAVHQALEKTGMPEGRIVLGQAVTYFAGLPKSNTAYKGTDAALEFVHKKSIPVPGSVRNAPTSVHRAEGAGSGYRYPHDYPESFVYADYIHPEVRRRMKESGIDFFYNPGVNGQEFRIRDRLERIWNRTFKKQ